MSLVTVLFRIYRYFIFWLFSVDAHSLHSPFVYELYREIVQRLRSNTSVKHVAEVIRASMKMDNRVINVKTLGELSTISKSQQVSAIAKHGISSQQSSIFLVTIIEHLKLEKVLELGTSLGINTIYLGLAERVKEVVSVEGNSELVEIAKENFKKAGINNVSVLQSDINSFLDAAVKNKDRFDFIFIDANHTLEATLNIFDQSLSLLSEQGVIVLDDINWSSGMRRAWCQIRDKSSPNLTVENYKFGIVFSEKYVAKGSFVLGF